MLDHQYRMILSDHLEQFRGFLAFRHRHSGHGLVQHQQVRLLDQQHANLQPLLLTVAERGRRFIQAACQEDGFCHLFHGLNHRLVPLEGQCPHHAVALGVGHLEVFEHSQILEHRRCLELPAHARMNDLVFLESCQFLACKPDGPGCGLGLAADQIQHGGFTGAIGADNDPNFLWIKVEGQVIHGLETIE